MYTFPQIILNPAGNSYLAEGSKVIAHKEAQKTLSYLLKNAPYKSNTFWVYEICGNEFILRAAQSNVNRAIYYFNNGDNSNRVIVHFGPYFIPSPKH